MVTMVTTVSMVTNYSYYGVTMVAMVTRYGISMVTLVNMIVEI